MADITTENNLKVYEPGAILDDAKLQALYEAASAQSYRSFGAGDIDAQYQTILSKFDRYGKNILLPNHELTGYTFITRPKLNLTTQSINQDRILAMLNTDDQNSLHFAIRCYLDTKLASSHLFQQQASQCPFFNDKSPFIVPLCNTIVNLQGPPDYVLETEDTTGGYYSENQTFVVGSDRMNRTTDLTLTFREIQGGFIFSLFLFWVRYIDLVSRGEVMAYLEDIDARRLNYTVSIYRFLLDPSRTTVTKWGKFTGCFPKNVPMGPIFGFNDRDSFVPGASQLSIPFTANNFEPMDPIIFRDFNSLMVKYGGITDPSRYQVAPANNPNTNFAGLPWIDVAGQLNRFVYLCEAQELQNPLSSTFQSISNDLQQALTPSGGSSNTTNPAPTVPDPTLLV